MVNKASLGTCSKAPESTVSVSADSEAMAARGYPGLTMVTFWRSTQSWPPSWARGDGHARAVWMDRGVTLAFPLYSDIKPESSSYAADPLWGPGVGPGRGWSCPQPVHLSVSGKQEPRVLAFVTIAECVLESRTLISPRLGQRGGGGDVPAAAAPERGRRCRVEGPVAAATFSTIPHLPTPNHKHALERQV